ncbi:MAG TPA: hypothetical protein ENN21_09755, partial [Spirochaetes bacterium]|nr:hypothetical protein [Spirochaetota bacterium]
HVSSIKSVAAAPDGKLLLTAGEDKTIKLWDMDSGKEIRTFTTDCHFVTTPRAVAFHKDGRSAFAYCAGNNKQLVHRWDVATGRLMRTYDVATEEAALSPDGRYILGKDKDGSFGSKALVDIETGKVETEFPSCSSKHAAFSPNGKYFAVSLRANLVTYGVGAKNILWETEQLKNASPHKGEITALAFSPDSRHIATSGKDDTIKIWHAQTGAPIGTITENARRIHAVTYSTDGKYILSGGYSGIIYIYDAISGKLVREIAVGDIIESMTMTGNGKYIVAGGKDKVTGGAAHLYDFHSGKLLRDFQGDDKRVLLCAFTGNGLYAVWADNHGSLSVLDMKTGHYRFHSLGKYFYPRDMVISTDDTHVFIGDSVNNVVQQWNIGDGKKIRDIQCPGGDFKSMAVSPDGRYLLTCSTSILTLRDAGTGEKIKEYDGRFDDTGKGTYSKVLFSRDGDRIIATGTYRKKNHFGTFDVKSGKLLQSREIEALDGYIDLTPDGKNIISGNKLTYNHPYALKVYDSVTLSEIRKISRTGEQFKTGTLAISPDNARVATNGPGFSIVLWDLAAGKEVKRLRGHLSHINNLAFSADGRFLLSGSSDNTVRLWNLRNGGSVAYLNRGEKWAMFTDDGYFDGSDDAGEMINLAKGRYVYAIDQFAVRYNRPDIIYDRIEYAGREVSGHYYHRYLKRLNRSGINESDISADLQAPHVIITRSTIRGKQAFLSCSFRDTLYDLQAFNVYVNDVPLYGAQGRRLEGRQALREFTVELSHGMNKIEVTCFNKKGVESPRALTTAVYNGDVRGDLYFLGFGVSEYKDSALNLKYADKDTKDLADVFSHMKSGYRNVFIKTHLNAEVTVENVRKAKDFLKNAKVDDTFVLFIAGHGVHDTDREATYYYLTHNADKNRLKETCAPFELIEGLLQGIGPRNKLFLMDTCESGEIDDAVQEKYYAAAGSRGLRARTARALTIAPRSGEKRQVRRYLFQKNRYIYNDLMRRFGAIVFSSSKGGEFSYESDHIQNGYFTREIINALTSRKADKNNDGKVST